MHFWIDICAPLFGFPCMYHPFHQMYAEWDLLVLSTAQLTAELVYRNQGHFTPISPNVSPVPSRFPQFPMQPSNPNFHHML